MFRIKNKSEVDGCNFMLGDLMHNLGPGETMDVQLDRDVADALPGSMFDVLELVDRPAEAPAEAPQEPSATVPPEAPAAPAATDWGSSAAPVEDTSTSTTTSASTVGA